MGPHIAVALGIDARRCRAALDCVRRVEQQLAHHHDAAVGCAEIFLRAVGDDAHAFLDRHVLGVDALDAGKARRLLRRAVDEIVVLGARLDAVRARHVVVAAAAVIRLELLDVIGIERRIGVKAAHPVVDPGLFVVDRNPDVAVIPRHPGIHAQPHRRDVRPHLLEWHHILADADERAFGIHLAVRDIVEAVTGLVQIEPRRAVQHE